MSAAYSTGTCRNRVPTCETTSLLAKNANLLAVAFIHVNVELFQQRLLLFVVHLARSAKLVEVNAAFLELLRDVDGKHAQQRSAGEGERERHADVHLLAAGFIHLNAQEPDTAETTLLGWRRGLWRCLLCARRSFEFRKQLFCILSGDFSFGHHV